MNNMTPAVKQLLIINIIFFLGSMAVPNAEKLLALYYFESPNFKLWQPLTHMFMHGGLMHIAFNMFALMSFGSLLENIWGSKKFLFFYLSCGLGAALLHSVINYFEINYVIKGIADLNFSNETLTNLLNANGSDGKYFRSDIYFKSITPILENSNKINLITQESFDILFKAANTYQSTAVGASGAVYGLMVAFAFMFPNAELALMFIPVPIKAKYFVPGLLAIDLFLGFGGSSIFGGGGTGIAHFAHIGGAIVGFVMMWYWKKNAFNNNRWN